MENPVMKTSQQLIGGFSIAELLVALLISSILMLGVVSLMTNSKRAYNVQNDTALVHENVRFTIDFLSSDLQMAGYFGCSRAIPRGKGIQTIIGIDNVNRANFGSDANNSDVIMVSFLETNDNTFSVTHEAPTALNPTTLTPLKKGETSFSVTKRGELFVGDNVIASDCVGVSPIYNIAAIDDTQTTPQVTLSAALDRKYDNKGYSYGSEIRRLIVHRYFIGKNGETYSLFRDTPINSTTNNYDINQPLSVDPTKAEEIIQGVENMQIRYLEGIDTDFDGEFDQFQYNTSNNVVLWNNVLAVRLTLLLSTLKERFDRDPDDKTYDIDRELGGNYDPPDDQRRRMIFTTTVKLRNK